MKIVEKKVRNKSPKLSKCKTKSDINMIFPENLETPKVNKDNEITVYKLISSIFQNNLKKEEIIKKHRPCFSLKVIPNREIDKVYSSLEKIPVEKIDLVEEFKYEEEEFESKNIFEVNSKSFGLSNFDVDLSMNIFGHKQKGGFKQKDNNIDSSSKDNSKIYCIHTIFISLFRTIIDFKDIKLAKQTYEELKEIEKANATDKKILFKKFVDKFGLYIPLESVIGGRMNISFIANNEEEKNMYHNAIQKDINAKLGGGFSFLSGKLNTNYNNSKNNDKFSQSLNKVKNTTTKIIGGDYLFKNDLKIWIKSFNIDNLQVIEYKTLIPIYCFIPGFEDKFKICLKSEEDIVLQQIYDLIENKYKKSEEALFEGSSMNSSSWNVGLINDNYNSFTILKERYIKNIIITKNQNASKNYKEKIKIIYDFDQLYICGKVPDGCIICGWELSTDVNSKPYNIISSWNRKKELKVIGNRFFKFKLDINISEIKKLNKDIIIKWFLDVFYINKDFIFKIYNKNDNIMKNNNDNIWNNETVIFFFDEYKINNIIFTENEHFNFIATKKQDNTLEQKEINEGEKPSFKDIHSNSDINFNDNKEKKLKEMNPLLNGLIYKAQNNNYYNDNLYGHQMTQTNFYSQNYKKAILSLFK